jgi:hypothetical protein
LAPAASQPLPALEVFRAPTATRVRAWARRGVERVVFGEMCIDQIKPAHIEQWKLGVARLISEQKYQHYAMTCLGYATGLRPSSLRALRRKGETPDVLWDEGVILVRRSATLGEIPNETASASGMCIAVCIALKWYSAQLGRIHAASKSAFRFVFLVGTTGFEPATPTVSKGGGGVSRCHKALRTEGKRGLGRYPGDPAVTPRHAKVVLRVVALKNRSTTRPQRRPGCFAA